MKSDSPVHRLAQAVASHLGPDWSYRSPAVKDSRFLAFLDGPEGMALTVGYCSTRGLIRYKALLPTTMCGIPLYCPPEHHIRLEERLPQRDNPAEHARQLQERLLPAYLDLYPTYLQRARDVEEYHQVSTRNVKYLAGKVGKAYLHSDEAYTLHLLRGRLCVRGHSVQMHLDGVPLEEAVQILGILKRLDGEERF